MTYLLGQLYKDQQESQEAMKTFATVLKKHPEYKMEFYTRIQMAMSYAGNGDVDEVRKELLKMLLYSILKLKNCVMIKKSSV